MWKTVGVLIGIGAVGAGVYLLVHPAKGMQEPAEPKTGEVYTFVLSGVRQGTSAETLISNLSSAMGWNQDDILEGRTSTTEGGTVVLTVAFKDNVKTPALPPVGFTFTIYGVTTTVTAVQLMPASTKSSWSAFS